MMEAVDVALVGQGLDLPSPVKLASFLLHGSVYHDLRKGCIKQNKSERER